MTEIKFSTESFMKCLEALSGGNYLPLDTLKSQKSIQVGGVYVLEDGRNLIKVVWEEDEELDTDKPMVLADIEKAYGITPMKIPKRVWDLWRLNGPY